jgi:hypothetical protein
LSAHTTCADGYLASPPTAALLPTGPTGPPRFDNLPTYLLTYLRS